MYNVFMTAVQTQAGIDIVRNHSSTRDGNLVFRDLVARYRYSPAAQLELTQLKNDITMAQWTPSFSGSYEAYMIASARRRSFSQSC